MLFDKIRRYITHTAQLEITALGGIRSDWDVHEVQGGLPDKLTVSTHLFLTHYVCHEKD